MDIFELEPSVAYTGSYTDLVMTGSLPRRGVAISHTSGSVEVFSTEFLSDFFYFTSQSNPTLSNNKIRFVSLMSPNERYYDTFVPQISDIVTTNSGQLALVNVRNGSTGFLTYRYIFGGIVNGRSLSITASKNVAGDFREQISDNIWLRSFPFENRYKNIFRTDALSVKLSTKSYHVSGVILPYGESIYGGTNTSFVPTEAVTTSSTIATDPFWGGANGSVVYGGFNAQMSYILSGSPSGSTSYLNYTEYHLGDMPGTVDIPTRTFSNVPTKDITVTAGVGGSKPFGTTLLNINKHLYGFGDSPAYNSPAPFNDGYVWEGSSVHRFAAGAILRGWKYGLYSAFPIYSKAIFRRDRYGHFRDMLEQRLYSKFFDVIGINSDGSRGTNIGIREGIINVVFVSGTIAYTTASNPGSLNSRDSGIYDFEAKSGQPFYDLDRI